MEASPALVVGFVPGVTVTKWTRIWAERHPGISLTVLPVDQPQQVSVVLDGTAQLSFVRLPINSDGLHVIPLYVERAVAVAAKDHLIAAADAVTRADLAHETINSAGTKHADREAFDLVAAGVGVLVVPQSIARLHGRKDVVVRPMTDGPETQIALVWRAEVGGVGESSGELAELIAEFVGIVRGRTARSSRSSASEGSSPKEGKSVRSKNSPKDGAKASRTSQRSGAEHALNRKRADARKKRRGR